MTINWGSYSGNLRVGIQVESTTTPTNGSSTCTVTVSFWVSTSSTGAFQDNQALHMSQSGGSSISDSEVDYFNALNENQQMKVGPNQTVVYAYSDYGVGHSVTINANVDGLFNGGTPSKSISTSIPARPWASPAATTAASASRTSDTQASVSWTNHDSSSAAYANVKLYRKVDGGSYALRATLGVVASYSDTGIAANHKYRFRPNVLGKNGTEVTGAESGDIWTTPGDPTACTATKETNNDVTVTWTNNVSYSEYTTRIEHSDDGGSTWAEIGSAGSGIATYTDPAPSTATTHTYRVRARTSSGTTLNSSYSTSGTVTLLATANPPTGLAPSGIAVDATGAIVLTWTHNPADGTPQSKRHVQAKVNAGSYADLVNDSSTTSSYTVTAGTWTNGDTITWKVATAGQNGTLSAYSAESTITLADVPTATITAPGATLDQSTLTVEWTYFQAQSHAQAGWVATLLGPLGNLRETQTGTTETSATFVTTVDDATSYTVTVVVTSADGLDSALASQAFSVTYLPPAAVAVTADFDELTGWVAVTVAGDDPVAGVTEAIASVAVERSLDGGTTWVTVVTGVVLDTDSSATIVDTTAKVNGTNTYRAVALSALPSTATSESFDIDPGETTWGYLSTGVDGFATVARVRAMPSYTATPSRGKALYHFAGRGLPVELAGEAIDAPLAVSGALTSDSATAEDFEAIAVVTGIVCWRGPDGRRVFGSLSGMQTARTFRRALDRVEFTVTQVDYTG